MLEIAISFVANTMSFLRVGGFILSHAGMMSVVFTLAGMFGPVGYAVTVALGNLFVIGLEGLVVGIQVLRLEFYEMFGRYYSGDGVPFYPQSRPSYTKTPRPDRLSGSHPKTILWRYLLWISLCS